MSATSALQQQESYKNNKKATLSSKYGRQISLPQCSFSGCHSEQTNSFVVLLNKISDRFQSNVDIPSSVLNTYGHLSLGLFEWPPLMLPLPLA